jgi:nitrogen regulatory protein PII-like uncharacterized protein
MKAQVVFFVERDNLEEIKDILRENSITKKNAFLRNCESLGLDEDGYYLLIETTKDKCDILRDDLEDVAEEIRSTKKEEIIERIEDSDDTVGLSEIFE